MLIYCAVYRRRICASIAFRFGGETQRKREMKKLLRNLCVHEWFLSVLFVSILLLYEVNKCVIKWLKTSDITSIEWNTIKQDQKSKQQPTVKHSPVFRSIDSVNRAIFFYCLAQCRKYNPENSPTLYRSSFDFVRVRWKEKQRKKTLFSSSYICFSIYARHADCGISESVSVTHCFHLFVISCHRTISSSIVLCLKHNF